MKKENSPSIGRPPMANEHKKKKVSATIDRKLMEAAEEISRTSGISISQILERALEAELLRGEGETGKALKAKRFSPKLLKSPQAGKDTKSA